MLHQVQIKRHDHSSMTQLTIQNARPCSAILIDGWNFQDAETADVAFAICLFRQTFEAPITKIVVDRFMPSTDECAFAGGY
jgi:hypothetical protein